MSSSKIDQMEDMVNFYKVQIDRDMSAIQDRLDTWTKIKGEYEQLHTKLQTLPDKTRHPYKIPIGRKAFMLGELVHTNEIMVLLGDNYFAERSAKQALDIVGRRIDDVSAKVNLVTKEKERMEARRNFTGMLHDNASEVPQQHGLIAQDDGTFDIREPLSDEDDTDDGDTGGPMAVTATRDTNNVTVDNKDNSAEQSVATDNDKKIHGDIHVSPSATTLGLDSSDKQNALKAPERWLNLDFSDTLFAQQEEDTDAIEQQYSGGDDDTQCRSAYENNKNADNNRNDIDMRDASSSECAIPSAKPKKKKKKKSNLTAFAQRLDELERLEAESDELVTAASVASELDSKDTQTDALEDGDDTILNDDDIQQLTEMLIQQNVGPEASSEPALADTRPRTDIKISHTPVQQPPPPPRGPLSNVRINTSSDDYEDETAIKSPADIYTAYTSQVGTAKTETRTIFTKAKHLSTTHTTTTAPITTKNATTKKTVTFTPETKAQAVEHENQTKKFSGSLIPEPAMTLSDVIEHGAVGSYQQRSRDDAIFDRNTHVTEVQSKLAEIYMMKGQRGNKATSTSPPNPSYCGGSGVHGGIYQEEPETQPKMSLFMQRRLGLKK